MERFSKKAFAKSNRTSRERLLGELANWLTQRLAQRTEFHQDVFQLVSELRNLGHDLWSFDESDDREVWAPNYHTPSGAGIVVTFTANGGVDVESQDK